MTRTLFRPSAGSCEVDVIFAGRIPMRLDLAGFVSNDLYCLDDHYESTTLRLWRELARQAAVVLDVGSHVGTFALVAAEANPAATVLAIEADRESFHRLAANCAPFPNVAPLREAIADRSGPAWLRRQPGNDGATSLVDERSAERSDGEVEAVTLPELCRARGIGRIDLMKLDVEGMEERLLADASLEAWGELAPRHLLVELRLDRRHPAGERLLGAMARRGYRAERVQGLSLPGRWRGVDLANWYFRRESG